MNSRLRVVALALAVSLPAAPSALAQTFLGPAPYVRRADSPFDLSGLGATFFLEDFEDGALDTPGVTPSAGSPTGPGGNSDSVDDDDGAVDGSGTNGRDYFSTPGSAGITFTFDEAALGGLPTAAGIVWTDGTGAITFEAFDATGAPLGSLGPIPIADTTITGQTDEDRFFGVFHAGGISAIRISNTTGGIEVDHLQYGQATAPPAGCAAAATFSSLDCRLAALIARVEAESALGDLQAKLARAVRKARTRGEDAEESCGQADVKRAKKRLQQMSRKMIQYAHRLGGLRGRRQVPEGLRQSLVADGNAIKTDGLALRAALTCPEDAAR